MLEADMDTELSNCPILRIGNIDFMYTDWLRLLFSEYQKMLHMKLTT